MIETVRIAPGLRLEDYASYAHLAGTVGELRAEGANAVQHLQGRTVWMVNSTSKGGGVAEMLPRMIAILRELDVDVQWVVIGTERRRFFDLTKHLHNLIHGEGDPSLSSEDVALYEQVSRELADELEPRMQAGDILVVHDPQPCGMGALLRKRLGIHAIWRCHIGLDAENTRTRAAWSMLRPHVEAYDHSVFSAPEYIPEFLSGRVSVLAPAIDPLTEKNRPMTAQELMNGLCNAGLSRAQDQLVYPDFEHRAMRLRPNGAFTLANEGEPIGLLYRPVVTQISRWDRLKGWKPLLDGFATMKRRYREVSGLTPRELRRLELVRLVMAGPEPAAIQDDPEATEVLDELCSAYRALEPELQRDVALLSLPMGSLDENALMVNALQQCSSIVAQNSLREGFGLTVTEAMWKRVAVLGSAACGIRQQIRDGIDGRLHEDAESPTEIADLLVDMLAQRAQCDLWARRGQRRVHDEFLVFAQLRKWLRVLTNALGRHSLPTPRPSYFG